MHTWITDLGLTRLCFLMGYMMNQVAEKMSVIEQYKMERERQQKVHDLKRHDLEMMFLQCY